MPANPLNREQLKEAALLKRLFMAWQAKEKDNGNRVSQENAAELLGFNQSALNQYLNGKIPLNVDAAIKLAAMLGCQVLDFSPSLARQAERYAGAASSGSSKSKAIVQNAESSVPSRVYVEAAELLAFYMQFDPEERESVLNFVRSLESERSDHDRPGVTRNQP